MGEVDLQQLVGRKLPRVDLPCTDGSYVMLAGVLSRVVVFFYPYTGVPGIADPPGWDGIAGAHGSTPQALAFSEAYGEFRKRGASVFGVSLQDTAWQQEFVARNALAVPLLSDVGGEFSKALDLPRFVAGNREFLVRVTLIAKDGVITHARHPVVPPQDDAARCLDLLG